MQVPTASELLTLWERARAQPVATKALMLLSVTDDSSQDLAKLSIGGRDARLLALREALFGSRLAGVTDCPKCGLQLELSIDAADLRTEPERPAVETLMVSNGNYEARFRLPNSEDLAAIGDVRETDETAEVHTLLSRCLVEVRKNGRRKTLDSSRSLPQSLIDAIAAEMERADPQANVELQLNCADCRHQWLSTFDVVSFLWSEVDNWARRVLGEVCVLASAFGWRESDILAMSAQRRQLYLQMIGERA
jgi:hypothetical protein